ncbi:MAG: hypothetical protein U0R80_00725 [Nocardioidaceae bacterium]
MAAAGTTTVGGGARVPRGLVPLLLVSGVVLAVTLGLARGVWVSNLHNGLLALAFTLVGAYVAYQRPGHPEARLFLATGSVHAVMFLGRQIGHDASGGSRWWAWLGVWPIAASIGLATLSVLCFPDGRLPSPRWRPVAALVVALAAVCSVVSMLWPVELAASGITAAHPFATSTPGVVAATWSVLAHPAYAFLQLLWPVALWSRWRAASGPVRGQLAWLLLAAAVAAVALATGLAVWRSPVPGVLAVTLLPVAAGLAIVHGQHATTYAALTWMSRRGPTHDDLPTDLARATAEALTGRATLWLGSTEHYAVGVWPPHPTTSRRRPPTTSASAPPSAWSSTPARSSALSPSTGRPRCPSPRPGCSTTWPPRRGWCSSTSPSPRWSSTSVGPATSTSSPPASARCSS